MTDLEQSALAVYFANCQGIKSDPLPMLRKILALGEGDRRDAARYRYYRASTVRPILFGDDGWSEQETDAAIDTAMSALAGEGVK